MTIDVDWDIKHQTKPKKHKVVPHLKVFLDALNSSLLFVQKIVYHMTSPLGVK